MHTFIAGLLTITIVLAGCNTGTYQIIATPRPAVVLARDEAIAPTQTPATSSAQAINLTPTPNGLAAPTPNPIQIYEMTAIASGPVTKATPTIAIVPPTTTPPPPSIPTTIVLSRPTATAPTAATPTLAPQATTAPPTPTVVPTQQPTSVPRPISTVVVAAPPADAPPSTNVSKDIVGKKWQALGCPTDPPYITDLYFVPNEGKVRSDAISMTLVYQFLDDGRLQITLAGFDYRYRVLALAGKKLVLQMTTPLQDKNSCSYYVLS